MLHELPIISLPIDSKVYKLYVAQTVEQKKQGLSGIDHLPDNHGMIFVYDDEKPRTFVFKDTCLPLVVYFIGSSGKVLQKSFSSPGQAAKIKCNYPIKWVIEVPHV